MIKVALPKGRLGEKAYGLMAQGGYACDEILQNSRKLVFENHAAGVRYFWVKPSDVAIYVERGAADIGVAGKDILLEYTPDIYELLDLKIGNCRMCTAGKSDFIDNSGRILRVATKFTNITRGYFDKRGREIDIIKLNGSIELAPLLGLSDLIVDIVETGKTLFENDLKLFDTIVDISARLIVNKAAYRFNHTPITALCEAVAKKSG